MKRELSCMLILAVAACGGSSSQAPTAASPEVTASPASAPTTAAAPPTEDHHEGEHAEGGHPHGGGDHHAGLSPELKDFHGVMKPVWHSEPGPGRVEKACAETKAFSEKAAATKDAELVAGTTALAEACQKPGRPDVEAKLSAVHTRFHALLPKR